MYVHTYEEYGQIIDIITHTGIGNGSFMNNMWVSPTK